MPKQLRSADDFRKYIAQARECRVVRSKEMVKLKLRLPNRLLTYLASPREAEALLGEVKKAQLNVKEY